MMIWIGIEIRILRFLLILMFSDLYQEHNNTVKYFLFQSIASIILLLSLSLLGELKVLGTTIIMIKLGIAPFHLWFISLINKVRIVNLIWLTVIQKIIPLRLIVVIKGSGRLITLLISSFLISVVHIVVQTKLTTMVGASSVYSISWVVISLISRESLIWYFFVLYCIFQISTLITVSLIRLSPFKPSSGSSYTKSKTLLAFRLNIAGFPPSFLFFTKLGVILEILSREYLSIGLIIILGARVVIYNYINITIITFTISARLCRFN